MNIKPLFQVEPICNVVHCKKKKYDIYIGRPSKWGNPFTHLKSDKKTLAKYVTNTREEAIEKYEDWILNGDGKYLLNDLEELYGKTLGCWCKPKKCHGDILVKLIYNLKKNKIKC